MAEPNVASPAPATQVPSVKRRWWWWRAAFPLGLILANAAVAAVYLQHQPQYEAAALLEINENTPYIACPSTESGISKDCYRTQVEIIRSKWILHRTIASANIKDLPEIRKQTDPVEWLKKRLSVVSPGNSDVFEIKYASADPKSAALVVNEITRQYLTAQEEEESSRFRSILAALNQQLRSHEEKVRTLRQEVETATRTIPLEEPEQGQGQSEPKPLGKNPLAELRRRLIDMHVEHAMLAARIKAWEEKIRAAAPPAGMGKYLLTADEIKSRDELVERELDATSEVMQLESQVLAQQTALDRIEKRLKSGKDDPLYKRQREEIAASEKSIEDLKKKLRPRIEKEVDSTLRSKQVKDVDGLAGDGALLAKLQDELRRLRVELRSCEIAEENLRSAYSAQLSKSLKEREQMSGESLNLKFKKDELAEAQTVLARISDRLIALQTERSAPPRVIWHEPAKVPEEPIESHLYGKMALAGSAAFCFPYVAGFIALVLWNLGLLIGKLEPVPQ